MEALNTGYHFFWHNTWRFDDVQYLKVCESLNKTDAEEFFMDMRRIDMTREGKNYSHGLAKYYMLEDIPAINSGFQQVVQMNQLKFDSDIRFGAKRYKELKSRDLKELYPAILDASKYEKFLKDLFVQNSSSDQMQNVAAIPVKQTGTRILLDFLHAQNQLNTMHAKICRRTLAISMAYFNRKFRQITRGIYLQQQGFDNIRKLLQAGERVVLMPVYRSFADLPMLLYSLFVNNIEIPFTIGN